MPFPALERACLETEATLVLRFSFSPYHGTRRNTAHAQVGVDHLEGDLEDTCRTHENAPSIGRAALKAGARHYWRGVGPHGNGLLLRSIRSNLKPLSENALNSALRRMGYSKDEMTAHGFRSTASTICNERRLAAAEVIEVALAHQDEDDVPRVYNRALYIKERTVLMKRWADLLDEFRQHLSSNKQLNNKIG